MALLCQDEKKKCHRTIKYGYYCESFINKGGVCKYPCTLKNCKKVNLVGRRTCHSFSCSPIVNMSQSVSPSGITLSPVDLRKTTSSPSEKERHGYHKSQKSQESQHLKIMSTEKTSTDFEPLNPVIDNPLTYGVQANTTSSPRIIKDIQTSPALDEMKSDEDDYQAIFENPETETPKELDGFLATSLDESNGTFPKLLKDNQTVGFHTNTTFEEMAAEDDDRNLPEVFKDFQKNQTGPTLNNNVGIQTGNSFTKA